MRPRIYRHHPLLRAALAAALVGWLVVTAVAAAIPELSLGAVFKSAALSLFFTAVGAHYLPFELEVDEHSLTRRTLLTERRIRFSDVTAINVLTAGHLTSYGVLTEGPAVQFTSFIAGHRELLHVIAERTRVPPRTG